VGVKDISSDGGARMKVIGEAAGERIGQAATRGIGWVEARSLGFSPWVVYFIPRSQKATQVQPREYVGCYTTAPVKILFVPKQWCAPVATVYSSYFGIELA
jgi:hypothetical protein